ncbi:MAG: hypothetical protein V2I33_20510 [Kangiellaceae bacterium]|jgi:hypothetical protein|nr:hypothetical protein [Kangiellaceae bacterium]
MTNEGWERETRKETAEAALALIAKRGTTLHFRVLHIAAALCTSDAVAYGYYTSDKYESHCTVCSVLLYAGATQKRLHSITDMNFPAFFN